MKRTITIDLDAAPAAIAESVRQVIAAHGYAVMDDSNLSDFDIVLYARLEAEALDTLLAEIGRNTAQALQAIEPES